MTTFCEMAAHPVDHMLSLYCDNQSELPRPTKILIRKIGRGVVVTICDFSYFPFWF